MARVPLVATAAIVLAACTDGVVPTTAPDAPALGRAGVPAHPGTVAFHSTRDGNFEIYSLDPHDGSLVRLTSHPAADQRPDWSANGKQIVFQSSRDGDFEIFVMNADGSGVTQLTRNGSADLYPVWSPDGKQIAFSSNRDGNVELYVMEADGSDQRRLTYDAATDAEPDWSPNGREIAFGSNRSGRALGAPLDYDVFVIDADGSNLRQLTASPGIAGDFAIDDQPAWSPNGREIAFRSRRDGYCNVYVMASDGSDERGLTNTPPCNAFPSWSRDGQQVVFTSLRSGNPEIWSMNADGTGAERLTNHPAADAAPVVR